MGILGLQQGPEVGKALEMLREKVIEGPEWNTEEQLIAILEEMKRKS
jgi:hypothetical protein